MWHELSLIDSEYLKFMIDTLQNFYQMRISVMLNFGLAKKQIIFK